MLSVVLVLLAVCFLNKERVVEAADNLVLLEKRHPGYWKYLRPEVGHTRYVPPSGSDNLLISDIQNQEKNGVSLTVNSDWTITLNGTNTSDDNFSFILGNLYLPDGDYIMSDGLNEDALVKMYLWANELNNTAAYGSKEALSIDNEKSSYHVGIQVVKGANLNNVKMAPMISIKLIDYKPYLITSECDKALLFYIQNFNEIGSTDIDILKRLSSSQISDYSWISVVGSDGQGIQITNNKTEKGLIDPWGRAAN